MTEKLDDTWSSRDFPVLVSAARAVDRRDPNVTAVRIADSLAMDLGEVFAALDALDGAYLRQEPYDTLGGRGDSFVTGLTERGRRVVGLWPSGENVDALVDALRQAEEQTDDPEEKSAIRRAAGAVLGVSRDVMVDVVAAVVARQSGLG